MQKRQYYTTRFKAKVAREALKEDQTLQQIASTFDVDPSMVTRWKNEALENLAECFSKKRGPKPSDNAKEIAKLYQKIGQLEMQNEYLRGKL